MKQRRKRIHAIVEIKVSALQKEVIEFSLLGLKKNIYKKQELEWIK